MVMTQKIRNAQLSRERAVRSALSTEEGALEGLFGEHWSRLVGLLTRLVGDRAEAEDLALESFWKLYQRGQVDDPGLNAGGWLRRVATNLGLNAIRSFKRREKYELDAGHHALEDGHPSAPAEIFAVEEERACARLVLASMPERQAHLLVLRYSGASYQEIASDLGVSPSSIGPLLARAEREFERRYRLAYPEGG